MKKKLLKIGDCYYCTNTDKDKCICLLTDRRHPQWGKGIPEWCPLPDTSSLKANNGG